MFYSQSKQLYLRKAGCGIFYWIFVEQEKDSQATLKLANGVKHSQNLISQIQICEDFFPIIFQTDSALDQLRGHPKMSTFSQVYQPYARGGKGNTRCTLLIYNNC